MKVSDRKFYVLRVEEESQPDEIADEKDEIVDRMKELLENGTPVEVMAIEEVDLKEWHVEPVTSGSESS